MVDITTLDLLTSSSEPQNLTGLENLKQYCPEYEEEAQLIINVLQPFFSGSSLFHVGRPKFNRPAIR